MRYRFMTLLTALVLAAGGSRLMAQETTGAVTGRITDPQGLAVPGATVTLTGPQGAKTAVTDAEGRFSAPLLVPGTYVGQGRAVRASRRSSRATSSSASDSPSKSS